MRETNFNKLLLIGLSSIFLSQMAFAEVKGSGIFQGSQQSCENAKKELIDEQTKKKMTTKQIRDANTLQTKYSGIMTSYKTYSMIHTRHEGKCNNMENQYKRQGIENNRIAIEALANCRKNQTHDNNKFVNLSLSAKAILKEMKQLKEDVLALGGSIEIIVSRIEELESEVALKERML